MNSKCSQPVASLTSPQRPTCHGRLAGFNFRAIVKSCFCRRGESTQRALPAAPHSSSALTFDVGGQADITHRGALL